MALDFSGGEECRDRRELPSGEGENLGPDEMMLEAVLVVPPPNG